MVPDPYTYSDYECALWRYDVIVTTTTNYARSFDDPPILPKSKVRSHRMDDAIRERAVRDWSTNKRKRR